MLTSASVECSLIGLLQMQLGKMESHPGKGDSKQSWGISGGHTSACYFSCECEGKGEGSVFPTWRVPALFQTTEPKLMKGGAGTGSVGHSVSLVAAFPHNHKMTL